MDYLSTVISLIFVAYIIWREHLAYLERRELVDRLMAKNLPEFKDNVATEPNHLEDKPSDLIDLEDGREELTYGEAN